MEQNIKVLIKADGNSTIGLGHIVRTLSLAAEFSVNNYSIIYFTEDNKASISLIKDAGFTVFTHEPSISQNSEVSQLKKLLKSEKTDILIIDSNNVDNNYINRLDLRNIYTVLLDNKRDMGINVDLIINGAIYATELKESSLNYNRNTLLGIQYFILRKQFRSLRQRKINPEVKKILITMGGSDPLSLTSFIIESVRRVYKQEINVLVGDAFTNVNDIERTAKKDMKINLHYGVKNVSTVMIDNDICISAGGTTLYELAVTGTPAIVVQQAEGQILPSQKFHKKGAIINLGDGRNITIKDLGFELIKLISDYEKRKRMSKIGKSLVDGNGTVRCVKKIDEGIRAKRCESLRKG